MWVSITYNRIKQHGNSTKVTRMLAIMSESGALRLQEAYVLKCSPTQSIYEDLKTLRVNGSIFAKARVGLT